MSASDAEVTRARLFAVVERTRNLAAHYAHCEGDMVGADLRSGQVMREQLRKLTALSELQAKEANLLSQTKREEFAKSDQRLRKVEERARELAARIIADLASS